MTRTGRMSAALASVALPLLVIAGTAQPVAAQSQADRLEALIRGQAAKIEELNRELQNLKKQQNATDKKADAATRIATRAPVSKGGSNLDDVLPYVKKGNRRLTWNVPGTDFDLRIGGYAKGDFVTRVAGKGGVGSEDNFAPTGIFTRRGFGQTAATDAASNIHARQTRLFFEATKDNTPFGPAKVAIEGDLFGAGGNQVVSNSTTYRLRHAYGQIGGFLFGQFWTTFSDPSTYAETLDFGGPGGQSFIRQAQIRYVHNFDKHLSIAGAVENPEGRARVIVAAPGGVNAAGTNPVVTTKDTAPDFIGRVRYEDAWGHVQVSGVVSRTNAPNGIGQGQYGYGALLSAKLKVPVIHEKDEIYGQAGYTDGASRYIQDVATQQSVTYNSTFTRAETLQSYGFFIGYQHWWTNEIRSTATYGFLRLDTPAFANRTQLRNTEYAAGNIIWSPWAQVDLGLEVQWGERIDRDSRKGTQTRIQSSLVYRF